MVLLVPLGVFRAARRPLILVAYVFDCWLPMLFLGIPLAAVLAELVWRN